MTEPLLDVAGATVHFPTSAGWLRPSPPLRAVEDVSFTLDPGETLGIVGESGCGKSTLARAVLGLQELTSGSVRFAGRPVPERSRSLRLAFSRAAQIVFQDPLAALNPRLRIGETLAEPLRTHAPELSRSARAARVADILRQVGLDPEMARRFPHEFSGGQAQRIGIARAMILRPRLLVCDEPVASLDVSIQAQIINLLRRMQAEHRVAMLFISHDLSVVRHIAHRVMVMYLGRIAEIGPVARIFDSPAHPYTRALIDAVPRPDPLIERTRPRLVLSGDPPSPSNPPSGCVFRTRCPIARSDCAVTPPRLEPAGPGHSVACPYAEKSPLALPGWTG